MAWITRVHGVLDSALGRGADWLTVTEVQEVLSSTNPKLVMLVRRREQPL